MAYQVVNLYNSEQERQRLIAQSATNKIISEKLTLCVYARLTYGLIAISLNDCHWQGNIARYRNTLSLYTIDAYSYIPIVCSILP